MTRKLPSLPSDELAMLATVEAASNAGQYTVIQEPPPVKAHAIRLRALQSLAAKGWIQGGLYGDVHLFWTDRAKVFKAVRL